MSPAPSGSLALQHVELGDALEIRDGIIFNFCSGLPHVLFAPTAFMFASVKILHFKSTQAILQDVVKML